MSEVIQRKKKTRHRRDPGGGGTLRMSGHDMDEESTKETEK